MSAPLVDLGMPAYLRPHFIAEAIESVLAQTHTNWRLLVSENGPGGGEVEADLTESGCGSARVSSVVGSSGCSMAGELLGLALGLVGLGIQVEVVVVQQAPVVGEAGASASASGRR